MPRLVRPLHEAVRLLRLLNQVVLLSSTRCPFLHLPAVTRIERLSVTSRDQILDAALRDFDDELTLGRHEREELSVDLEAGRAEAFPAVRDAALFRERVDDGEEPRVRGL